MKYLKSFLESYQYQQITIQDEFYTDLWLEKLGQINCMFYEK